MASRASGTAGVCDAVPEGSRCIMRDIIGLFFIIPFGYKVRVVLALTAMTGFMFFTVKCPNPFFNTFVNLPMMFASLAVAIEQFNRACARLRFHYEDRH